MSKYAEIIYPDDEKNIYPFKLAQYLYSRFISRYERKDHTIKILDIGCSKGTSLNNFSKCSKNLDLYGVDLRREILPNSVTFKECNLETDSIPFPDNSFDVVVMAEVLEHLPYPLITLSEIKRVLKKNGEFIGNLPLAYHLI